MYASRIRLAPLLIALAGVAAARPAAAEWLYREAAIMGTRCDVELWADDRARGEAAVEKVFAEMRRIDSAMSTYKPDSEVSRVNMTAAAGPVQISRELYDLIASSIAYSTLTRGTFDITYASVGYLYDYPKHIRPDEATIAAKLPGISYLHLHLDPQTTSVSYDRPGVRIDFGGIGKGYAVDRMVDILKRNGITTALVAASASSIYGLGAPPSHPEGWAVDIRDPWQHSKTVAEVFLKNMSMSTSGSYEKFFRAEGRVWAHIMDPRTGYPAQGTVSVSVITPRTIDSEAWAKPYFVNGRRWAEQHKPKDFRIYFCQDRTDQPCAWLQ